MSSVASTAELYQVLSKFSIPVLQAARTARSVTEIVGDMLRSWRKCYDLDQSRRLIDALEYIFDGQPRDGAYFTPEQTEAFFAVRDEQARLETAMAVEDSGAALDDFLDSFKIIGGDAL